MALYPGAVKELIAPGSNDPRITAIGVILHTDAGNVGDLHDYFDGPSGGIESHFHIPKNAAVKQYRDTAYEADANYKGNSFMAGGERLGFISVETQGLASEPWNDYQLAEIKELILWAKSVHPRILLRVCPAWNQPGIGYHTLFGSPGPWTPVAKSCPGPKRIQQFNDVLVPWFAQADSPEEEDPMAGFTPEQFGAAVAAALSPVLDGTEKKYVVADNNYDSQRAAWEATAQAYAADLIAQSKAANGGAPLTATQLTSVKDQVWSFLRPLWDQQ